MSAIPSEFAGFIHDVAKRALDDLAERVKEIETPLRPTVRSWSKLSDPDKDRFIDELIASARGGDTTPATKPRKKAAPKKRARSSS